MTIKDIVLGLLALPILALSACTGSAQQAQQPIPEESVSVQLSWIHTIEFAGFYMAQDRNHYSQEGLAVELRAGGNDANGNYIDPLREVAEGRATFGVTDGGLLLIARANGDPVVAIATIYQRHPLAFVSLADKNIERPQDLVGRTVDIADNSKAMFLSMLSAVGVPQSQVNLHTRTDYTIDPLVNGQMDVIEAWITNEIVDLELGGYEFNMILPSDYGIDMYPDVIFTTEETIANRPEMVEKFLRATLRGVQDAIDDPAEAATLSVSYNSDLNVDRETRAMERSLPLLNPSGSKLGMMTPEHWETTQQILLAQGLLSEPLDVSTAYTMTFLNSIYGQ